MFSVGNKVYTVKFNQDKFRELDPSISAALLIELNSTFDKSNKAISDSTLNSLFIVGLEEDETGKRVPFDEANRHYKKLIEKNGIGELKQIVTVQFYTGMPEFFNAINKQYRQFMKSKGV